MNLNERQLITYVCDGDIRLAKEQARIIAAANRSQKDADFCRRVINQLDRDPTAVKLPREVDGLLIQENMTEFPSNRFILRRDEEKIAVKVLNAYKVASELKSMGVKYQPSVILHGPSGTGKTMLARYIAHKAQLPFLYVNFSHLVNSHLGETQSNIGRIFKYARSLPCVLCFDEIDAIGMCRGQEHDVGEMARVVIALMQEMDRLPNELIVIGTTNRFDRLDPALIRRFTLSHEVPVLHDNEILCLAEKFFRSTGTSTEEWLEEWCRKNFSCLESAANVVNKCTEKLVSDVLKRMEDKEE